MLPNGEKIMSMTGIAATVTASALAATLMVPLTALVKAEMRPATAPAQISLLMR